MAKPKLNVRGASITLEERHWTALELYADEYGYTGRSPALRRILELSPQLKPYLAEKEPTPCPNTS